MSFIFNNQCQYSGCGKKFGSLTELFQHVERVHIVMNDREEVSGSETMVPQSKIFPNNINGVMMWPPVHPSNHGPRVPSPMASVDRNSCIHPIQLVNAMGNDGDDSSLQSAMATLNADTRANAPLQVLTTSVNQNNCVQPFQLVNAIGNDGDDSSLQSALATVNAGTSANAPLQVPTISGNQYNCVPPLQLLNAFENYGTASSSQSVLAFVSAGRRTNLQFQVPMVSTNSNNCVPPFQSAIAQTKHGAIPKMNSIGLAGNHGAELFNNDDIPSSSSAVKRKNNSSKMSSQKKRISSINLNVEPFMAKANNVPTQPTSTIPSPKFIESTHIAVCGLSPNEIVQHSVLRADYSQLKPFPCPILGCKKRYRSSNGIKYHAESYERELKKMQLSMNRINNNGLQQTTTPWRDAEEKMEHVKKFF